MSKEYGIIDGSSTWGLAMSLLNGNLQHIDPSGKKTRKDTPRQVFPAVVRIQDHDKKMSGMCTLDVTSCARHQRFSYDKFNLRGDFWWGVPLLGHPEHARGRFSALFDVKTRKGTFFDVSEDDDVWESPTMWVTAVNAEMLTICPDRLDLAASLFGGVKPDGDYKFSSQAIYRPFFAREGGPLNFVDVEEIHRVNLNGSDRRRGPHLGLVGHFADGSLPYDNIGRKFRARYDVLKRTAAIEV